MSSSKCPKQIEKLRIYFGKECGKENEWRPKSGSAHKSPFRSSWPWYTELAWLKDHIAYKESTSNFMPKIEVDGESVGWKDETRFEQEAVVTPTRKRGRNNSEEILVKAAEEMVAKLPVFGASVEKPSLTDDDLFGQLIARKLSKLPESEEKEDLKLNIQVMIKQAMYSSTKQPISGSVLHVLNFE